MNKKKQTTDLSNIKLQGDKRIAEIFTSGGDVGSTAAAALTILINRDRAPKEDVIKSCVVLGGLAGTLMMGFKSTQKELSRQYQIPSERREDLQNTLQELGAAKENLGLEKQIDDLMAELSGDKIGPSGEMSAIEADKEPTEKELQAELIANVKKIKAIKARLSEVEKKGKKKSTK